MSYRKDETEGLEKLLLPIEDRDDVGYPFTDLFDVEANFEGFLEATSVTDWMEVEVPWA